MSKSKNIEVGKNVIKIEAQAVAAIADRIGDEFESAVNSILNLLNGSTVLLKTKLEDEFVLYNVFKVSFCVIHPFCPA